MSSNSRELSELGGIISSDQANNQLVIATGIRFPDNTVQTTAGVAVDQYARNTANLAASVNTTQNNNIIFATNYAQAAFDKANTGSSGGLAGWTVVDNNFTVANNVQLIANTTVSGFTITLPASPVVGNTVVITDGSLTSVGWSNNGVTVARNGKTILGYADNLYLNVSRSTATLVYDGTTWQVSSTVGPKGDTGPAGPIGNTGPQGAGVNATQRNYRFNATNNQTIFVGADAYSQTLSYNVNAISVYLNGVYLRQTEDYFANNGTSITLTSGTLANDALDVITFQSMSLTAAQNTITTYVYTASAGQTSFGGADINGNSLNYNTNNLFVTLNGLTLRSGVDYLQSNSSYIALTAGAVANDELSIVAFGSFQLPGTANTVSNYYYTTTAGQTIISGTDLNGRSLSYGVGNLVVSRNGATLRNGLDYTAGNGTSVTLINPAYANDEIGILTFTSFNAAANGYTQAESNARYLSKIADDTLTGNVTFASNIIATGTGSFQVPQGTTAQRPSATSAGLIRFNTSLGTLETANGTAWSNVGSGSASSGGGGVSWQPVQNTNFIAIAGNGYFVNTAIANVTVTLPATPVIGNLLTITDYARTFSSNNLILYPNGNKIQSNTANISLNVNGQSASFVYADSIQGWIPYSTGLALGPYLISALLVAGGGGGGGSIATTTQGGGGGAGGLISTSGLSITPGVSYTISVGSGGSGGVGTSPGTNGGNATFAGLTATGGGFGGAYGSLQGNPGGSGGGGGTPATGYGSGTSGQGYRGGQATGYAANGSAAGGGGGGANGVGGDGSGGTGGSGGGGLSSSFSGSSVTYAGGGGGGGYNSSGPGGSGGGANGGAGSGGANGNNGGTNLGGGGGGSTAPGPGPANNTGGNGGSGIVIITYFGPQRGQGGTVTTSAGYTIHTFNSSGTFVG